MTQRVAVTNGAPQGAGAANTLPQTDSSPLNSREDYGETDDEMDIRTNLAAEILCRAHPRPKG